jgi:hypothetical protein
MPIGRLFFEIAGDSSKLNASLREAIATAKEAGVQITHAGQAFISKFDEAVNPTQKLTEQIQILEAAGKKQADIMKVMSGQIQSGFAGRELCDRSVSILRQSRRLYGCGPLKGA